MLFVYNSEIMIVDKAGEPKRGCPVWGFAWDVGQGHALSFRFFACSTTFLAPKENFWASGYRLQCAVGAPSCVYYLDYDNDPNHTYGFVMRWMTDLDNKFGPSAFNEKSEIKRMLRFATTGENAIHRLTCLYEQSPGHEFLGKRCKYGSREYFGTDPREIDTGVLVW